MFLLDYPTMATLNSKDQQTFLIPAHWILYQDFAGGLMVDLNDMDIKHSWKNIHAIRLICHGCCDLLSHVLRRQEATQPTEDISFCIGRPDWVFKGWKEEISPGDALLLPDYPPAVTISTQPFLAGFWRKMGERQESCIKIPQQISWDLIPWYKYLFVTPIIIVGGSIGK